MKKRLTLAFAILTIFICIVSCKKSDIPHQKADDPSSSKILLSLVAQPAFQVKNNEITVAGKNDTTVKLKFMIDAPANISSLSQVIGTTKTDITEAKGKTSYEHTVTLPLSFSSATPAIKFFVVDGKDKFIEKSFTVNYIFIGAGPIATFTDRNLGGNASSLISRMDLDLGEAYFNSSINGNPTVLIPQIDVFVDDSTFRNNDYSTRWPQGMGSKFGPTNFTPAQFNAMTSDVLFQNLVPTKDTIRVGARVGQVIVFSTKEGHKGLAWIRAYNGDKANGFDDVKFDIKVQK